MKFRISQAHRIACCLVGFSLLMIGTKYVQGKFKLDHFFPDTYYEVRLKLAHDKISDKGYLKTFVPRNTSRQAIKKFLVDTDHMEIDLIQQSGGKELVLTSLGENYEGNHEIQFMFEAREVDMEFPKYASVSNYDLHAFRKHLKETALIQSDDPAIIALSRKLRSNSNNLKETVYAFYRYVHHLPYIESSELLDALTTLKRQEASCNGKSRLFVALCRASQIPARLVGGVILENTSKKTSHQWAEVWVNGQWHPMCVTNGYFSRLPSNYMELYWGDEFLFKHLGVEGFNYAFNIHERKSIQNAVEINGPSLLPLYEKGLVSHALMKILLVLPLCAIIIAFFKNIVGLQSYGTFLPALIAIGMASTGFWFGLVCIGTVLGMMALIHGPLDSLGILNTPKLAIMLIIVIATTLTLLSLGANFGLLKEDQQFYMPIVMMAILAERFTQKMVEEDVFAAGKLLLHTMVITLVCFSIFQAEVLLGFMICFPELLLIFTGILMIIGNWIGMRWMEYGRFWLVLQKASI